jgi:hypothetical protein
MQLLHRSKVITPLLPTLTSILVVAFSKQLAAPHISLLMSEYNVVWLIDCTYSIGFLVRLIRGSEFYDQANPAYFSISCLFPLAVSYGAFSVGIGSCICRHGFDLSL